MGRKRKARPATPEADDDDLMELDSEGKPIQRNAANARERARMRVLSKAFGRLKTTLPWVPADTKLSKLDTLRLASCYIAHLRNVLAEDEASGKQGEEENKKAKRPAESSKTRKTGDSPIHPITLTWPFTFNGKVTAAVPNTELRPKDQSGLKDEIRGAT